MENRKRKFSLLMAASFLVLFIIFTIIVKFVDVKTIGPQNSKVGLASVNNWVHKLLGTNMFLYNLTDWLSLIAIAIILTFAVVGLVQWIKRKSLFKVDGYLISLGIFYLLVGISYVLFEFVVINHRPVLIGGVLEASYPSSTTMLSLTVCLSAIFPMMQLIKNAKLKLILQISLIVFSAFLVIGRIISGVHWITDIVGAILLSTALLFAYDCLTKLFLEKNKKEKTPSKN